MKAAAKYGARITLAEMLGAAGSADAKVAETLAKFTESRWDVTEEVSKGLVRDMLLDYASRTGRTREIVRDNDNDPVGVTDDLKLAFVKDIQAWATKASARLGVLAETSP